MESLLISYDNLHLSAATVETIGVDDGVDVAEITVRITINGDELHAKLEDIITNSPLMIWQPTSEELA